MPEINEALEYFKKKSVYEKLFKVFKKKYESLGKIAGTAVLIGLDRGERLDLSDFLMKDFTEDKEVRVSVKLFEKALLKSKFSNLTTENVLARYFGEELRTKKEKNEDDEIRKAEYLAEIRNYNADKEELKNTLIKLVRAIPLMADFTKGEKKELLAVFAAKTTANPHFFDDDTIAQSLLIAFLKDYYKYEYEDGLSESENKSDILFKAGIIKDSLSNDVIAYGIRGRYADGSLHQGMEGFFTQKEPLKLSLFTLGNLEETFITKEIKRVYIVENPAVFSILISHFPDGAFICSYGQIRRAVFMLLDLFDKNITFSYAGDFDPEGLLIAEKLKKRYGERLTFWKYEPEIYLKYISEKKLTEQRIKKLDGISDTILLEIADLIRKEGRAVYQESMLGEYLS